MFGATSLALAVSLSMDSFAAALGQGAARSRTGIPEAFRVGLAFGACQLLMAVVGWGLGVAFADLVQAVDHWIAFGLLLVIGASMVRNAVAGEADDAAAAKRSGWLSLLTMAVATSIDASAVGVGLAMADMDIATTATLVGMVTFLMGFAGVLLGRAAGPLLGRRAEFVGGLGLVAIGAKILVEHTLIEGVPF
ncbi:manganese efflux pump MntP family protein [Azospirillum sp. SYSU D00513]|uniref:manganese efflux pump MntP n=1 Tax=Azospirillum sp. SYSU D00513 TaxID=2812561 RepID=UPI001A95A114|nr:manganese efflux pump MntP family protein [Azospirillum sp. SYSU D00513]